MSTLLNILTTSLAGIITIAGITYQPPVQYSNLQYQSFCHDDDTRCIIKELDFIKLNHRTPVTDIELTETYNISDEELFSSTESYSTMRKLPLNIDCTECTVANEVQ